MGAWGLEQQVRLVAGILVLASTVAGVMIDFRWLGVTLFVGLGLTFSGLTDICAMRSLLARLPWNRSE